MRTQVSEELNLFLDVLYLKIFLLYTHIIDNLAEWEFYVGNNFPSRNFLTPYTNKNIHNGFVLIEFDVTLIVFKIFLERFIPCP